MRHQKYGFDVDVEHAVESRFVHLQQRTILVGIAGIVDDDIDLAEFLDGCCNQVVHLGTFRHVAFDGDCTVAKFGRHCLRTLLVHVRDYDFRAFRNIVARNLGTESARRTGDNCDPAIKHTHDLPLRLLSFLRQRFLVQVADQRAVIRENVRPFSSSSCVRAPGIPFPVHARSFSSRQMAIRRRRRLQNY